MWGNIPSKERSKASRLHDPDIFVPVEMLLYLESHNIRTHCTGRTEKLWRRAQSTAPRALQKPVENTSSPGWPALIATLLPVTIVGRESGRVGTAAESK